jgi:hypothetical protein
MSLIAPGRSITSRRSLLAQVVLDGVDMVAAEGARTRDERLYPCPFRAIRGRGKLEGLKRESNSPGTLDQRAKRGDDVQIAF